MALSPICWAGDRLYHECLAVWSTLYIEECDVNDVSLVWLKHVPEKEIDWRELVTYPGYDKLDKIRSILNRFENVLKSDLWSLFQQ